MDRLPAMQNVCLNFIRAARRALGGCPLAVVILAAMAAGGATAAAAQSPSSNSTPLGVMGFSGASNWPLFVAQDKGYFARHGVEVRLARAPNSVEQLTRLIEGKIDIAMTAFDNVVAYAEEQGEVRVNGDTDLIAFLGVNDGGRFQLMSLARIARIADLKGRTLGVDAVTTGYAFVLREMLRHGGLDRNDYQLASVGGSRNRWEALRSGEIAATLLNAPYDAEAAAAGFKRLANSGDVIGAYQGSVGATRRAWAKSNTPALIGFIRGYVAAIDWLYEPANRDEAIAILRRNVKETTRESAETTYRDLLDPQRGGLSRRAAFNVEGAKTVLRLRSSYAEPAKRLTDPLRYYDAAYYQRAIRND